MSGTPRIFSEQSDDLMTQFDDTPHRAIPPTPRHGFMLFAQHGCILTGASPELALTVGRAQPKVRVSAARRNLKEAIGKRLV